MTTRNTHTEDLTTSDPFTRAFGDSLDRILDIESWTAGADLTNTYARLEHEVRLAVDQDRRLRGTIRDTLFPRIEAAGLAGPNSGVYRATPDQIASIHNGLLLNGSVEACDGIAMAHDTLSMTFIQIGVCLVTYDGDQQTWSQRMFRRDCRSDGSDALSEMLDVLDRRRASGEGGRERDFGKLSAGDRVSRLARRGIQEYAQRMFLTRYSDARWKMCQGSPAPFELLTGAGLLSPGQSGQNAIMTYPLMLAGVAVLRELLLEHERFVFIPKRNQDRDMLTIGHALAPLEYAVIDTISDRIEEIERAGHYDHDQRAVMTSFRQDVGDTVVRGVFRASGMAPPRIFYAHRDHVHAAALIALADSVLQQQRSYPVLLDLAEIVCRTTFGIDSFAPQLRVAYTDAGQPWTATQM